jgi:predicted nuclease of predicted toxin-antitoxin system
VKFKVDENLPARATTLLQKRGHDAMTVEAEGLAGREDSAVFAAALREDRILVTLDRGFADIRQYQPGRHPGIIVIRLHDHRPPLIEGVLQELLSQHDLESLAGCTVIAQPGAFRIRRPDIGS